MACEHLLGGRYPLCLVVQGLMTPSLAEMRAYCTTDHSLRCPVYQQHATTQAKVPLDAAVAELSASVGEWLRKTALRKPSLPTQSNALPAAASPAGKRIGFSRE